jgi:hypothetical protein
MSEVSKIGRDQDLAIHTKVFKNRITAMGHGRIASAIGHKIRNYFSGKFDIELNGVLYKNVTLERESGQSLHDLYIALWETREGKPYQKDLEAHIENWRVRRVPPYSTDMAAAWMVFQHCIEASGEKAWAEALAKALHLRDCEYNSISTLAIMVKGLNPEAICQAALMLARKEV